MKRVICLAAVLWYCAVGFSQKEVAYNVTKADIYLSGAKICSESKVSLENGVHTLIVKNITNNLAEGTLRAKVSEGAHIISVTPSVDYMAPATLTTREQQLYDRQKELNRQLSLLNIDKETIKEESNLIVTLINNDSQKESGANYTVAELENISKFYASKISQLKKENYRLEQEIATVREELNKINAQLREEKSMKERNTVQVELVVQVSRAGSKVIELNYFVSGCGWTPQYDIKADNKDQPIEVVYKASVWQSTGVDWDGTEVTLMTNQPAQDQNRPILSPVYVDVSVPYEERYYKESYNMRDAMQMNMLELSIEEEAIEEAPYYAPAISTDINIIYHIPGKQAISGNGKHKQLTMERKNIPVRFVYHTVPKLSEQVYLLAYIPAWHSLNLINGTAAIYLQEVFIGNIQINEYFTGEEYPLSFGVDNRISVKRNKKQDFASEAKIGSEKKEKLVYELVVRNNLSTNIEVEILDQVPISKNKSVKVIPENFGNAAYTESIGLLKWTLPIPAGKSATTGFSYELRYPKDHVLNYTAY